ncbi:MAG: signal peptidase II [Syntrophothermaceae bacterium]
MIMPVVIGLDQAVKVLVQSHLELNQSIPLIEHFLHITYVRNPGGAFGLLVGQDLLFLIAALVVIMISAGYVHKYRPGVGTQTALALLAGGAAGNFIDRIWHGQVIDFIDFGFWPVFNLADCAIVVGAVWLCWIFAGPEQTRGVNSWK